jgi:hypothetical protein
MLLFAVGLSYPGARLADWFVWLAAYSALVMGPRWLNHTKRGFSPRARKLRGNRLIQDLKRYRNEDGRELVRGTLAADFPPGQRIETLWIGFCPPFKVLPHVTAHATGNLCASVKVAQVLHNGAQLEVRLPNPASCEQVANIEFLAEEPGSA